VDAKANGTLDSLLINPAPVAAEPAAEAEQAQSE